MRDLLEGIKMKAKGLFMTIISALTIGAVSMSVSAEDSNEQYDVVEPVVTTSYEEATEPTETELTTVTEETTITTATETEVTETTSVTEITTTELEPEVLLGDVNGDGVVNVRDCAFIARKLANKQGDELVLKIADFNGDGVINIRDAASIATYVNDSKNLKEITKKKSMGFPTKPKKSDYNLNTEKGVQDYVNNMVRYIAYNKYGILQIAFDNSIDVWNGCSWDSPEEYIPDEETFLKYNIAPNGIRALPMQYESTVDELVEGMESGLDMWVSGEKFNDATQTDIQRLSGIISWKPYDGGHNYQVYLIYGNPLMFDTKYQYMKYFNITDEMWDKLEELNIQHSIERHEKDVNGDCLYYESLEAFFNGEDNMLWDEYAAKVLGIGEIDPEKEYWTAINKMLNTMTQEQTNRLNAFMGEVSSDVSDQLLGEMKEAYDSGISIEEFLRSKGL